MSPFNEGAGRSCSRSPVPAPFCRLRATDGREVLVDADVARALEGRRITRQGRYFAVRRDGRRDYLHHVVMGHPEHGLEIDHKNRDRADNRRENLRVVTRSQNRLNIERKRPGASGFRGVYSADGRWRVRLQWRGRAICSACFAEPVLAALARDDLVRRVAGGTDGLNFPHAMHRRDVAGFLRAWRAWEATVWFVKRSDGSVRRMRCVAVADLPAERAARDRRRNVVTVVDLDRAQYRCIPVEAMLCLSCEKKRFRLFGAPRAAQSTSTATSSAPLAGRNSSRRPGRRSVAGTRNAPSAAAGSA